MAERKKTPNILADLLGDKTSTSDFPASDLETGDPQESETPRESRALLQSATHLPVTRPEPPPSNLTQKSAARKDAEAVKPVRGETVLPAKQQSGETAKQHDATLLVPPNSVEEGEEIEGSLGSKVKVTFYLSEDAVDLLEEAQRKLRRLARGSGKTHSKAATSKSALLEEALKLACADLEASGTQSQLARILF